MNTNLKKLSVAIVSIALIFALALPAFAAEIAPVEEAAPASVNIPVYCDDDIFSWDENPAAIVEFFKSLGNAMTSTTIADEDVPLAAAPQSVSIPVYCDDDIFSWDENPAAIVEFFKSLGNAMTSTTIADEDVPLAAAPQSVSIPVYCDDDIFSWDDNAEIAKQIAGYFQGIFG